MSKPIVEQMQELNAAVGNAGRVVVHEFAGTRVARFLGWFYEWERPRIGDRLAKVATIILAANLLWIWPIAIIETVLNLAGFGH